MSKGLWEIALLLCFSLALARTVPTATILPFSGLLGTKEEQSNTQQRRPPAGVNVPPLPPKHDPRKPPPPPPPPMGGGGGPLAKAKEGSQQQQTTADRTTNDGQKPASRQQGDAQQYDNPDYPSHPPQFWAPGPFDHYGGLPPPPPGWMGPPPDWQQHESEWQLDEFLAREKDLLSELHNLTSILSSYEQREDLHMRQLDVLTERVMDVESAAAMERNELVEYRANCTEMGRTVALLRDEIEEWTHRCRNLTIQHEQDEEKMKDVRAELKARSREVEDFASAIETARLDAERNKYLAERKKKQKKKGFLYWLFGIGSAEEREEDRLQEAQEYARATLLRALQTERDSVEELENAVATLQQNNSAIAEMVESRDMLIDELNNRVAVFEEDKLVLKAALRQLQKEMKEEGPKTQKLIDDLKEARENVQRLTAEIDSIISDHQSEVKLFQNIISEKQNAINATESNMTVIGTYVDRLEERLADFALARRDIDIREQKCKVTEERVVVVEQECEELQKQAGEYETEHGELRSLLEDLVNERSELQRQVADISKEKEGLLADSQSLRSTIASLEIDVGVLGKASREWQSRATELESTVQNHVSELQQKGQRQNELEDILHETLLKMKQMEDEASRAAEFAAETEASRTAELAAETEARRTAELAAEAEARRIAELAAEAEVTRAAELAAEAEASRAAELAAEAEAAAMIQDEADNPYPEQQEESMMLGEEPSVHVELGIPPPPPPPGGDQATDQSLTIDEEPEVVTGQFPQGNMEELHEHSIPPVQEKEDHMEDESFEPPGEDDGSSEDDVESFTLDSYVHISGEISVENTDAEPLEEPLEAVSTDDEMTLGDCAPGPVVEQPPVEEVPQQDTQTELVEEQSAFDEDEDLAGEFGDSSDDLPEAKEPNVNANENDKASAPSLPGDSPDGGPPPIKGPPTRPPPRPNKIPFRAIRKAFSRSLGIHGVFTPPSRLYPTRQQKRQARLRYKHEQKQAKLLAKQDRKEDQ